MKPQNDLANSVGYKVSRAARLFAKVNEEGLRTPKIGVAYLPVLAALAKLGSGSQKELARIAKIEQPTMAQLLARMERAGFVERQVSAKDRRSSVITLTKMARTRLPAGRKVLIETDREALAGFSDGEFATLSKLLERLIQNLEAIDGDDKVDKPAMPHLD